MKDDLARKMDNLSIGAIRALVLDQTGKANSGHPGMPLDVAPATYCLWRYFLTSDPANPDWINRDRFVLSAGHCSALLYSLLHLCGYGLSMDDLKSFRQTDSLTPGHPEFGKTKGVDATAGPLGQGIAQAVGMAIAEKALQAQYVEGKRLFNHYTYCLCGDGCLQEGISQEAISMAGHMRLNKLILIYDANQSTLDGPTTDTMTENVKTRFLASEWNVLEVADGNDVASLISAIENARKSAVFPTMILVHSVIGFGSQNAGSHKTHGSPLTKDDAEHAKFVYDYNYPEFTVPDLVYQNFREGFAERGAKARLAYEEDLKKYAVEHPEDYARYLDAINGEVEKYLPEIPTFDENLKEATRVSSGNFIAAWGKKCPFAMGGSADVAGSTKTTIPGTPAFSSEHPEGRDIRFGIREFAMAAVQNGMLLHGGLRTFVGTFFVFSDYCKAAIRMAALEDLPAIYVFTHDSIAVGEDGPTHEPIEQLAGLRATPNVTVFRPADAKETWGAWEAALANKKGPSALILTRQNVPLLASSDPESVKKGAYSVYRPRHHRPKYQILATGSEVSLALDAVKILEKKYKIRFEVISMPSLECFEAQTPEYKEKILHLPYEKRFSLEMAATYGWGKYAKHNIGLDVFGKSGKSSEVLKAFGFTAEDIAERILISLKK